MIIDIVVYFITHYNPNVKLKLPIPMKKVVFFEALLVRDKRRHIKGNEVRTASFVFDCYLTFLVFV